MSNSQNEWKVETDCGLLFLVDTNVWLDWLLGSRRNNNATKQFFVQANKHYAKLAYAAVSLKDIYFIIEQDCKINIKESGLKLTEGRALAAKEVAWECTDQVRQLAFGVSCDESDLWIASKLKNIHNDLEDNLIVAAAKRAKATALITNDDALIRHCPIAALSVSDATSYLAGMEEF